MADLIAIRKILENYIITTGHTFREISLKIGRKDSYIQQYIKYGFPKRLNEIDRRHICALLDINEEELIDDELLSQSISQNPIFRLQQDNNNLTDFINIDIYDAKKDNNLNNLLIGRLTINYKEFYGWCQGNPEKLKILRINDDGMEPFVTPGSLIIYDTSINDYTGTGLYIINYDGQTTLKRLQKADKKNYILKSENPRYQDITYPIKDIHILGRATNCLQSRML